MNKKLYLHFSIGAVSLLLIDLLVAMPAAAGKPPPPPTSTARFTCRGSALRIDEVNNNNLVTIFEPEVANPQDDPCATGAAVLLSVGPVLGVSALVLVREY